MTMDGPLVKWVQVVDQRNNIFKALVTEADEIKADRNIMKSKQKGKSQQNLQKTKSITQVLN